MWVNKKPLWHRRSRGLIIDRTVLVDFSGKTWEQRGEIFNSVNLAMSGIAQKSDYSKYVTVLSFGEKLNVHRYWQPAYRAKPLEKGEWKRERRTAFYDALIEAMRMAYKRTGALVDASKARIEFIVYFDGVDTHSVATKEDVKKALEFVMSCPGTWDFYMELGDKRSLSFEEALGIELDYVKRHRHPKDCVYSKT